MKTDTAFHGCKTARDNLGKPGDSYQDIADQFAKVEYRSHLDDLPLVSTELKQFQKDILASFKDVVVVGGGSYMGRAARLERIRLMAARASTDDFLISCAQVGTQMHFDIECNSPGFGNARDARDAYRSLYSMDFSKIEDRALRVLGMAPELGMPFTHFHDERRYEIVPKVPTTLEQFAEWAKNNPRMKAQQHDVMQRRGGGKGTRAQQRKFRNQFIK